MHCNMKHNIDQFDLELWYRHKTITFNVFLIAKTNEL